MDIFSVTIAISLIVYIAIGNYAGRGVQELDDYYVVGRRAPTILIVGTLVASLLSATIFLGEAGFAYSGQAGPYVMFPQTACIGYVLGAVLFGRYLRRSRTKTVAAFFGERFNSKRLQALAGYTIIFALGGYLLVVTQGAAILLSTITQLSYVEALIVAWVSYTAFTMYSGSRGVILTDTLMFLLFTVATVAAIVYIIDDLGGVPTVVQSLVELEDKAGMMSWHGIVGEGTYWPTATDYLIWGIIIDVSWLVVFAVSPWQSSRHLMAKDEHVVLRAACYACLAVVLLQVLIYGLGGIINLGKSDIEPAESVTIWAAMNMMPELLGALMLAGITAAALSSASTFLSLVGFSASNDIGIHDNRDEKSALRFSRWMMLVLGSVALVAALIFPPNIFWLMLFIGTVFASSWGPVAIMSVWSKRITEAGAFWGMGAGLVFNVLPKLFETLGWVSLPSYMDPALLGALASLITVIVVSRNTEVSREEAEYRTRLHQTPVSDISVAKSRLTLWAPSVLLIVNGIVMPVLLIRYYVLPYQTATGTLQPDGSLDWFTGEMFAAMSWVVVYITLGIIAARIIRKDYGSGQLDNASATGAP